jgi:hypothetical protein
MRWSICLIAVCITRSSNTWFSGKVMGRATFKNIQFLILCCIAAKQQIKFLKAVLRRFLKT